MADTTADWRLTYGADELRFGSIESGYVFPTAPEIGAADLTNDDARRPRGDGVVFGQDTRGGTTVSFEIDVDAADEGAVLAKLGPLAAAWRGDAVRSTPGATAELVSDTGRTTFGRPRRFVVGHGLRKAGLLQVTADFATADDLWYGREDMASVQLVPPAGGGLIAPLASPLATTVTSDRSQGFTLRGARPTWPVFEIHGPITNPTIEVLGVLRMEFRLTLAYDETLVVDTRPWARSTLRNGASVAGALTRTSTRLSQAAIAPGNYELSLRGASDTGTAWAAVRWREAFLTP